MRSIVLLAVLTAFVPLAAPAPRAEPALKGWSGPKPQTPCRCRHRDGKALLGEKICQRRGGELVTLRCDLVLNNTSWTEIAKGCDVALHSTAPVPEKL